MKKLLIGAALAGVVSIQSASAYSFTQQAGSAQIIDSSTVTFTGANPAGVTITVNPDAEIVNASEAGVNAMPPSAVGDYLTVGVTGSTVFQYSSLQKQFSLLWGSVDSYNKIQFFKNGASVQIFTGQDLPTLNGDQSLAGERYVTFTGINYDKVVFTNQPGIYAFEVDNVRSVVPDGGMTVTMLGLAMTGIAMVRRKFNA